MSMIRVRIRQMRIPCRAGMLGLVAALAWVSSGATAPGVAGENAPPVTASGTAPPGPAQGASVPSERLTATVSAFDLEKRTVDLVTGVGHALRIRRVHLPPGLKVQVGKTDSALSVLTPGCLVRVECGHARGEMVASTVTLLRAPTQGRTP